MKSEAIGDAPFRIGGIAIDQSWEGYELDIPPDLCRARSCRWGLSLWKLFIGWKEAEEQFHDSDGKLICKVRRQSE